MIRTMLCLRAKSAEGTKLSEFFRDRGIVSRAISAPGCRSCELQVNLSSPDEHIVTATWRSLDDYTAWTEASDRANDVIAMRELLSKGEMPRAVIYEIILSELAE